MCERVPSGNAFVVSRVPGYITGGALLWKRFHARKMESSDVFSAEKRRKLSQSHIECLKELQQFGKTRVEFAVSSQYRLSIEVHNEKVRKKTDGSYGLYCVMLQEMGRSRKDFDVSDDRTANGLYQHAIQILEDFKCVVKLVAQTYDRAAVMAGEHGGLQTKIRAVCDQAFFVHSYAHKLNMVLSHLRSELHVLFTGSDAHKSTVSDLHIYLTASGLGEVFPEIQKLSKLITTIPATSASVRRSFSALKRIKNYLRNIQRQERSAEVLEPFVVAYIQGQSAALCHQDKVRPHVAHIVRRFPDDHHKTRNLMVGRRLACYRIAASTLDELLARIEAAWENYAYRAKVTSSKPMTWAVHVSGEYLRTLTDQPAGHLSHRVRATPPFVKLGALFHFVWGVAPRSRARSNSSKLSEVNIFSFHLRRWAAREISSTPSVTVFCVLLAPRRHVIILETWSRTGPLIHHKYLLQTEEVTHYCLSTQRKRSFWGGGGRERERRIGGGGEGDREREREMERGIEREREREREDITANSKAWRANPYGSAWASIDDVTKSVHQHSLTRQRVPEERGPRVPRLLTKKICYLISGALYLNGEAFRVGRASSVWEMSRYAIHGGPRASLVDDSPRNPWVIAVVGGPPPNIRLQDVFPRPLGDVLAEKQFNVGTQRLVVRSQRDRSTSSLVYGRTRKSSNRPTVVSL
ncbi:hypothetical protein PR048_016931 [Dryococelus australis]|uniref:HAT C-terminal dimerisation domain-containing protein n=1 Tax=Dryococelus australis TaxID=614101 RepID=A0ABQ9H897_9NEOP|nr:hypothetical protein PR048_016931 [Dryococelus australis]